MERDDLKTEKMASNSSNPDDELDLDANNMHITYTSGDSNSNDETIDHLIEMTSPTSHSKNVLTTDETNEETLSPDDVEYKLTESCSQKIPPCLLDKFDFRIDSELNSVNDEHVSGKIEDDNNEDDYIDEDLYHVSGDEILEVNSKKSNPNEEATNSKETTKTETPRSVLIPMAEKISTAPAIVIEVSESPANSEPIAKLTKPNEMCSASAEESVEKIQLNSVEMIDYIIKRAKQKEKAKAEHKLSSLISTYPNEDYTTRKKSHRKSEQSSKSKSKSTPTQFLDSSESAFIWTELEGIFQIASNLGSFH